MAWKVEFEPPAERELDRIDQDAAKRILRFVHDRLALLEDPRTIGEMLKGPTLHGFWKYRVGAYLIIVDIDDDAVCLFVTRVAHRREAYR